MDIVRNRFPAAWADVGPLVLRVVLGVVFAWHGYDKVFVKGTPAIAGFLGSLGIPLPDVMVYFLAYGELIGGILLILGLLTFWVSIVDIIIAAVAFLTVHMANGFSVSGGGYEFIILIFAASVSLLASGAGRYSIDAMISKKTVPSV
jgi:putative oxidoreductase